MKKLALIIAVAGIIGLSSCATCNTCEISSTTSTEYCSKDYTSAQIDAAKLACEAGGGTWK